MAKLYVAVVSPELQDLIGMPLDVRGKPNGLRKTNYGGLQSAWR
ncbi:MAG TPA: hypothetical protein VM842_01675 [Nitrospira sp.]|jgi:hypothetical protein|nr:hypothetical protein [Nitrospira sp.]